MRDLKLRAITALFFVVVMIGSILAGKVTAALLFGAILLRCLWEFYTLTLPEKRLLMAAGLLLGTLPYGMGSLGYFAALPQVYPIIPVVLTAAFFLVLSALLIGKSQEPLQKLAFLALGTLYIGLPFAALYGVAFFEGSYRSDLLLGLLFLTWINDTGAYVVGSLFGKKPLMPSISPKKTLEGTLGGLFFNLLAAFLLFEIFPALSIPQWLGLGLIASVFGTIGDLAESLFKRSMQVKDSGNLLPGHGGLLDRFDAFIFILPFAAIYFTLINI